jgi:hypothetical protein
VKTAAQPYYFEYHYKWWNQLSRFFWRKYARTTQASAEAGQTLWPNSGITITEGELFPFNYISESKEAEPWEQRSRTSHQHGPHIASITRMVDKTSHISYFSCINVDSQACFTRWEMLSYDNKGRRELTSWGKFIIYPLALTCFFSCQELAYTSIYNEFRFIHVYKGDESKQNGTRSWVY